MRRTASARSDLKSCTSGTTVAQLVKDVKVAKRQIKSRQNLTDLITALSLLGSRLRTAVTFCQTMSQEWLYGSSNGGYPCVSYIDAMNAMVHLQLAELRIGIWIFQVDQNPVQDLADNFLRGNCVPNVQLVPSLPSPPRNKSSALPVLAGAAGLLPKEDAFLFKSIESIALIALLQTFGIRQLLI